MVIGADGEVHDAMALSATRPEFEAAALEAVAQWEFFPGVKGQTPVNTRMKQRIAFQLDEPATPSGADIVEQSEGFWLQ
jgi:TonB family protein